MVVCGTHVNCNIWRPTGCGNNWDSDTKNAPCCQSQFSHNLAKLWLSPFLRGIFGKRFPFDLDRVFVTGRLQPGSPDRSHNHPQKELDMNPVWNLCTNILKNIH